MAALWAASPIVYFGEWGIRLPVANFPVCSLQAASEPFGASPRLNPSKAFALPGYGSPVRIPNSPAGEDCYL
jgi:hypothetical protein